MEVTRAAIIDDEPARRRPQDAADQDPDDRDPGAAVRGREFASDVLVCSPILPQHD